MTNTPNTDGKAFPILSDADISFAYDYIEEYITQHGINSRVTQIYNAYLVGLGWSRNNEIEEATFRQLHKIVERTRKDDR